MNSTTLSTRIALVGNPNCGKTTLFNALTGLRYKVANYPGVTVEKREGSGELPEYGKVTFLDLPGIYSMTGSSPDELVASQVITGRHRGEAAPEIIVAVVDASNLERNLYLISELLDARVPLIIALNMIDMAKEAGFEVFSELLSRELGVPVIPIIASRAKGIDDLKRALAKMYSVAPNLPAPLRWMESEPDLRREAQAIGHLFRPEAADESAILRGLDFLAARRDPPDAALKISLAEASQRLQSENIDALSQEANARYRWIQQIVQRCSRQTPQKVSRLRERIDNVIVHPFWGLIIFAFIMLAMFQAIFSWASLPMEWIDTGITWLASTLNSLLAEGVLKSFIVDGVIAGVGSVLVFVPQIIILFGLLSVLEDTGYLARAAFLMDRIMRRVGLQGRSFIPMLSSFACAIPGIMATRIIPTRADRLTTILVAPLMSCSARLPVYTVLIGAFIPKIVVLGFLSLQGLVLFGMYSLGIIAAAAVAWILKRTLLRREPAFFVMEMPPFRRPSLKSMLRSAFDRAVLFIKSAGTVILACSIVLWFLASFPKPPADFVGNPVEVSYAGKLGHALEPLVRPLGYGWELAVGIIASFAAREVFVSAMATVYNLADQSDTAVSLTQNFKDRFASGEFSLASALSLLVFYVFACMCMSTLAVCRRETGSWRWTAGMFLYMTALAYVAAFFTYRITLWAQAYA